MRGNNAFGFVYMLLIIVTMTFAVRASNNMLMTTVPLLAKYFFNYSNTEIGILAALMSLGTFLATILVNARLDAIKRRRAFMASSIGYAIVLPLFYLANPISLWALSAAAGVVLGNIMPNIITSAGLLPDRRARERLLSIYTLSLSVSLVVGPAIEALILKQFSIRSSFLFFAPMGIAVAALSPLIAFPQGEERRGGRVKVLSNPGFKTATYNILAYNIPFSTLTAFGGIYAVSQFHASYSAATGLFSLFFTTSLLARLYLSIRPVNKVWIPMATSVSMTVLGLILMTIARSVDELAGALLVLGVPHGLTYPLSLISITRTFRPEERNAANSQFFAVMMLIGIATPTLMGLVADVIGLRYVFGVLVISVLALLFMIRRNVEAVDKAAQLIQ